MFTAQIIIIVSNQRSDPQLQTNDTSACNHFPFSHFIWSWVTKLVLPSIRPSRYMLWSLNLYLFWQLKLFCAVQNVSSCQGNKKRRQEECENEQSTNIFLFSTWTASQSFTCTQLAFVLSVCNDCAEISMKKDREDPSLGKITDFHPLRISKGEIRDVWGKEQLTPWLPISCLLWWENMSEEEFCPNARDNNLGGLRYWGREHHHKVTWKKSTKESL